MTLVTASIDIDAPPERVYDAMLDPARLKDWVTIHRRINRSDDGAPHEGGAQVARAAEEAARVLGARVPADGKPLIEGGARHVGGEL
jgi:hypothetical protein